jgi:hypothetical protein
MKRWDGITPFTTAMRNFALLVEESAYAISLLRRSIEKEVSVGRKRK